MPEKLITLDDLKLVDVPKATNYLERLESLGRTEDIARLTTLPSEVDGNPQSYENAYITGDFEASTLEDLLYKRPFDNKNLIEDPNASDAIKNNGFLTIYYLVRQIVEFGPPFNVEDVLENVLGQGFKGVSEGTLEPATIDIENEEKANPDFQDTIVEITINNQKRIIHEADYIAFILKYPHVFETGQKRIDIIELLSKEPHTTIDVVDLTENTAAVIKATYEEPPSADPVGTHFVDISIDPDKKINQKLLLRKGYVKSSTVNSRLKDGFDTILVETEIKNSKEIEQKTYNLDQTEFKGDARTILAHLPHNTRIEVLAEGFGKNAIFSKVKILSTPNNTAIKGDGTGFVDSRALKRYSTYINHVKSLVTGQPASDLSFDLELPKVEVPEPNRKYSPPKWTSLEECRPYLNEKDNNYNIVLEYKINDNVSDYDIRFKGAAKLLSYYGKKSDITIPESPGGGAPSQSHTPISFVGKLLELNNGLFVSIKDRWSSSRNDGLVKYLVSIPRTYFEHPSLDINEFRAALPTLEELTKKTQGPDSQTVGFWWITRTDRIKRAVRRLKKFVGENFKHRVELASKDGYSLKPEIDFDENIKMFDQVLPKLQELVKLNNEKLDLDKEDVLAIGFDKDYQLKTIIFQKTEDNQIVTKYLRKGISCFAKEEPFSRPHINAYLRFYDTMRNAIRENTYPGLEMITKFTYPVPEIMLNETSAASKRREVPVRPKTPEPSKDNQSPDLSKKTFKTKTEVHEENKKLIDPVAKEEKYEQRKDVQIPNNDAVLNDFEALQNISESEEVYGTVLNKVDFEDLIGAAQSCLTNFMPQAAINIVEKKQMLKSLGYVDLKRLLFNSKFQEDLAVKCQVEDISPALAARIEIMESEYEFYDNQVIYSELELAGIETGVIFTEGSPDLESFQEETEINESIPGITLGPNGKTSLTEEYEETATAASKNLLSTSSTASKSMEKLDKELTTKLMAILEDMEIQDCVLELLDEMSGSEIDAELDAQFLGFDLGAKLKASSLTKTLEAEVDGVFKISVEPPTFTMEELPMDSDDPLIEIDIMVEAAAEALVESIVSVFKTVMTEFLNACADLDLNKILALANRENNLDDNLTEEEEVSKESYWIRDPVLPPASLDALQTNRPGTLDISRLLEDPQADLDIISYILDTMNEIPTVILTSEALELLDALSLALKPSEICAMLLGTAKKPIYKLTLKITQNSELDNIKTILSDISKIKTFFKSLGMFIDLSFCIDMTNKLSSIATYCENKLQDDWHCQQLAKKGFSEEECEEMIAKDMDRDKRRLENLNDLLNDGLLPETTPVLCAVGAAANESVLNTPHMQKMADSVIGQFVDGIAVKFDMELRGAKEMFVDEELIPGGGDIPRRPELGRDYLTTEGSPGDRLDSYTRARLPAHLARKSLLELENIAKTQTEQPEGAPEGFIPDGALENYLWPAAVQTLGSAGHTKFSQGYKNLGPAFSQNKPFVVDFSKQPQKSWPRNDINKRVVNKKLKTSLKLDNSNILSRSPINIIPNMLNGYATETEFLLNSNEPAKRHFTMIDNHKLLEAEYSKYAPVEVEAKKYVSKLDQKVVEFLKEQYIEYGEKKSDVLPSDAWDDQEIEPPAIADPANYIPNFAQVLNNYLESVRENNNTYFSTIPGFAPEEFLITNDPTQVEEGPDLSDSQISQLAEELKIYLQSQYGPDWKKLYYYSLNLYPSIHDLFEQDIYYSNETVMLPYIEADSKLTVDQLKKTKPETSKLVEISYPKYIQLKANDFINQVAPNAPAELKANYANIPLDQMHFTLYNHNSNFNATSTPANSADNIPFEVQLANVDLNFRLGLDAAWIQYVEDFSRSAETKNIKGETGLNIDDIDTAKRLSLQQYLLSKALSVSVQDLQYSDKNLSTGLLQTESTVMVDADDDGTFEAIQVPNPPEELQSLGAPGRREKFEKSCLKIYDLVFASSIDRMLKNIVDSEIFNIDIFDRLTLSNNTTAQQFLSKICFPEDGALASKTMTDILNSDSLKEIANESYKDQLCKTNLDSSNDPNVLSKAVKTTSILAFMRVVILENILRGLLIFASFELSDLLKNNVIFAHIVAKAIEKSANEFVGDYYAKIKNVCFDILMKELIKGKMINVDNKKFIYKSYKKSEVLTEYENINNSGLYNIKFILKTKAARQYLPDIEQAALLYVIMKQIDEIMGPLSEALESPIKEKTSIKNAFLATDDYMDVPYQLTDYSHFLGNGLDTFLPWRWLRIPADQETLGKLYLAQAKLGNLPEINLDNWLANLTTKHTDGTGYDIATIGPRAAGNVKSNDVMVRKILQKNNSAFYQTQWTSDEYRDSLTVVHLATEEQKESAFTPDEFTFKVEEEEKKEKIKYDIQTNLTSLGDATKNGGFVIQKYLKLIPHNLSPKQKLDFKACFNFGFDGGALYNPTPWHLEVESPTVGTGETGDGLLFSYGKDGLPIPSNPDEIQVPQGEDLANSSLWTEHYDYDLYWAFKSSPESIDIIDNTLNYPNIYRKDYTNLMMQQEGFICNINALDISILNSLVGQNFDLDDETNNDTFSSRFINNVPGQSEWANKIDYQTELELLGNLLYNKLGDYFREIKVGQRLVYVFPHNMDIVDDGPYGDITAEQLEIIEANIPGGTVVSPKNEKFKLKNKKFIKKDFVDRSYILDTTEEEKDIIDETVTPNGSFAGMLADSLVASGPNASSASSLAEKCFAERKYRTSELVFETPSGEQKKTLAANLFGAGDGDSNSYIVEKEANLKRIYSVPIGDPIELSMANAKNLTIKDILSWYVDKQPNTGEIENLFFGNEKRSFIAHKINQATKNGISADKYMTNKLLGDSEKKVPNLIQNYVLPDKVLKTMALMHVMNFPNSNMPSDSIFKASKQASINLIDVAETPQDRSFIQSNLTENGGAPAKFKEELDKLSASKADDPIVSYFQKLTPRFIMRYLVGMTDPAWAQAFKIQKQTGATEKELFTKIIFGIKPVPFFPIAPFGITPPSLEGLQGLGVLSEDAEDVVEQYNEFIRLFWPFGDIRYPMTGLGMTYLATGYVEPYSTFNENNNPDLVYGNNIPIDQMGANNCEPEVEGFEDGKGPIPGGPPE